MRAIEASPGRDQRLLELLDRAVDIPADGLRGVLNALEEDTTLVEEAMDLLASEDESFLSGSPLDRLVDPWSGMEGDSLDLPGYEIQGVLGEGGMGRVFLGVQESAGGRRVAIKVIRAQVPSAELVRRFAAERRALARLNHPAIAQLYGSGTAKDGRHFVVMEYVEGVPITRFCDEGKLGIRERLELFVAVCRGVEHAHRRQLLHRDLKPSNILITGRDVEPVPKIIDFGIARALDATHMDTLATGAAILGTPAYLSPEAVGPSEGPRDLDTRTDVYSLGVVLYELLVGMRPHEQTETDPLTLMFRIVEDEALRPSQLWESLNEDTRTPLAECRRFVPEEANRVLSGDLDWIVMKAIAKDRDERYGSVAELATDVERHLRDEPVLAGPPTWGYRAGKFVRRYRLPVAIAVLAFLSLVAGVIGTSVGFLRARAAVAQEAEARQEAEAVAEFLTQIFQSSAVDIKGRGRSPSEITARELLDEGLAEIDELQDRPLVSIRLRLTLSRAYRSLGIFDKAWDLLKSCEADLVDLEKTPEVREAEAWVIAGLGQLAATLAHPDEALQYLHRAEELGQAIFEEPQRTRFHALMGERVAKVLRDQGRFDESEIRHREAIELFSTVSEGHEDDLVSLINNLGQLYFMQERWAEAEVQQREALELSKQVMGHQHVRTAMITDNLAASIASQDRLDEAAPLFAEAFEIRRAILPEDHPGLALSLNNLATLAMDRGRPEEAEPYHRQALGIRQKAYGEVHPITAWSHDGLSHVLAQLGESAEAVEQMEIALDIRRRTVGAGHPVIARSLERLGNFAREAGDLALAEARYREALGLRRLHEREEDPGRASTAVDLAEVLSELGRPGEVPDLLEEAQGLLPRSEEQTSDLQARIEELQST